MLDELFIEMEERCEKNLDVLKKDFSRVRTGRASPTILDGIRVDYYNIPTPLNQAASISVPEPRMILINPFEKSMLAEIARAIGSADLGLNPSNDGRVVRVPIPALTEERRKELVKQVRKMSEESKVSVRNIRREVNDSLKKAEKNKEISEDELKRSLDQTQKSTDEWIGKIDEQRDKKEKEILEV